MNHPSIYKAYFIYGLILKSLQWLRYGVALHVGDGENIGSSVETNIKAHHFVSDSGAWDRSRLQQVLLLRCIEYIAAIGPPADVNGEDIMKWSYESSGLFFFKSARAFHLVSRNSWSPQSRLWKLLRGWPGPLWIRYLLRILGHQHKLSPVAS
ncbi:hypothetical protein Ancab_006266 [Ancistrocladus abbreviatus]